MTDNRFIRKLFFLFWRFKRPMTMGVRIFLQNERQEILLVRHTYVKGWYLPGGGVEKGETTQQAARKELREEANIMITGALRLFSSYLNIRASNRDHVLLFICNEWKQESPFKPNREIAEIGFFDRDNLPEGTTPSTRARIGEILDGLTVAEEW